VPTLDIRHLGVRYASKNGTVEALANVNLTMRDGDFVVAIGASGCGKTTLLSTIAGFLPPTEGEILLDGKPVTGTGLRPRRRVPEARAHAMARRDRQRGVRPAHARRRRRRATARRARQA
jgi:ABC-type sugar transport system ATPase subunit